jgi:hypothetical protein
VSSESVPGAAKRLLQPAGVCRLILASFFIDYWPKLDDIQIQIMNKVAEMNSIWKQSRQSHRMAAIKEKGKG